MMNRNMERIAAFFRNQRIQAGLTPEEVTVYVGDLTVDQFHEFENGKRKISIEVIFALVNLYSTPPDEVLDFLYVLASTPEDEALESCG